MSKNIRTDNQHDNEANTCLNRSSRWMLEILGNWDIDLGFLGGRGIVKNIDDLGNRKTFTFDEMLNMEYLKHFLASENCQGEKEENMCQENKALFFSLFGY